LNASLRRKLEGIERTLSKVTARSQAGIPVIVEGRRDKEALRRLRVHGRIVCVKSTAEGFHDFAASLSRSREVTVLTDFDEEGARLAAKLIDELTHMRVKADLAIWKQLKALCRPEIRAVEELADYVEKLREEAAAD
jgi:5S rRNA maturation endonuclease (ribonuclease M5)